jgi:hypothetical protein
MAQSITGGYDPFHSKANKERLLKAVKDAEQGKNMITKTLREKNKFSDFAEPLILSSGFAPRIR